MTVIHVLPQILYILSAKQHQLHKWYDDHSASQTHHEL